jgi:thioredoxin 1
MSELISHVTDSSFKTDVLESPQPVLVDFWAVWCGPCRAIAPHLEALSTELGEKVRIVKVNVDENQQTAMNYQIRSIPTLLMFKGGKVVDQMVGNPGSKAKLQEFISRHLDVAAARP